MWPDFLFSYLFFFFLKHCPMFGKMSQKTVFVFGKVYLHQTFTNYVFNQYIYFDMSICQIWLQIMKRPLILLHFLVIFKDNWNNNSSLKCFIFTKLSQIVCLINSHILVNRYPGYDYKLWKTPWFCCVFLAFLQIIGKIIQV